MDTSNPRASNVSRRLREAGHALVFPDHKREGMFVRNVGDDVFVTITWDDPQPDIQEQVDDVVKSLEECGYSARISRQDEYGASIIVGRDSLERGDD